MFRFMLASIAALILTAGLCAAEAPKARLTNPVEGLSVTVDGAGAVVIAGSLEEVGGKLAFCGVIWFENASGTARSQRRALAREVIVRAGSDALPVNAVPFEAYESMEEAQAAGYGRCSVSTRPWDPAILKKKLKIELRNSTYRGN